MFEGHLCLYLTDRFGDSELWPTQNLGDSIAIQKAFGRQKSGSSGFQLGASLPFPRDIWLCWHTHLVVTTRGKVCYQQVLG